jgi:hypothetical protein
MVLDRCGPKGCMDPMSSKINPIQKFDRNGKLITSFGARYAAPVASTVRFAGQSEPSAIGIAFEVAVLSIWFDQNGSGSA